MLFFIAYLRLPHDVLFLFEKCLNDRYTVNILKCGLEL